MFSKSRSPRTLFGIVLIFFISVSWIVKIETSTIYHLLVEESYPASPPPMDPFAIFASREDCPNSTVGGVHFQGNNDVYIDGGSVFSNACLIAGGSSLYVEVTGGDILYVTHVITAGSPIISPSPKQAPAQSTDGFYVRTPNCTGLPNWGGHNGGGTISPGIYDYINVDSGDLVMESGLYCLNGDFVINGSSAVGDGVTISMLDGEFITTGASETQLNAPISTHFPVTVIPDLLIYMPSSNAGTISLLGNATSWYTGTVFAPNVGSFLEIGGYASQLDTYGTQLIGGTVNIHGVTTLDINYDHEHGFPKP